MIAFFLFLLIFLLVSSQSLRGTGPGFISRNRIDIGSGIYLTDPDEITAVPTCRFLERLHDDMQFTIKKEKEKLAAQYGGQDKEVDHLVLT